MFKLSPSLGPSIGRWGRGVHGLNNLDFSLYIQAMVHIDITGAEVLRTILNIFLYIYMFNFQPLLGPHNWSWDRKFKNLESTLSENAVTIISQIVVSYFFLRRFWNFSLRI